MKTFSKTLLAMLIATTTSLTMTNSAMAGEFCKLRLGDANRFLAEDLSGARVEYTAPTYRPVRNIDKSQFVYPNGLQIVGTPKVYINTNIQNPYSAFFELRSVRVRIVRKILEPGERLGFEKNKRVLNNLAYEIRALNAGDVKEIVSKMEIKNSNDKRKIENCLGQKLVVPAAIQNAEVIHGVSEF